MAIKTENQEESRRPRVAFISFWILLSSFPMAMRDLDVRRSLQPMTNDIRFLLENKKEIIVCPRLFFSTSRSWENQASLFLPTFIFFSKRKKKMLEGKGQMLIFPFSFLSYPTFLFPFAFFFPKRRKKRKEEKEDGRIRLRTEG